MSSTISAVFVQFTFCLCKYSNLYLGILIIITFPKIFGKEAILRTDKGQPRPKYIFNKCGTNIYFFTLQRFGPSPSPNFKLTQPTSQPMNHPTLKTFLLSNSWTHFTQPTLLPNPNKIKMRYNSWSHFHFSSHYSAGHHTHTHS